MTLLELMMDENGGTGYLHVNMMCFWILENLYSGAIRF